MAWTPPRCHVCPLSARQLPQKWAISLAPLLPACCLNAAACHHLPATDSSDTPFTHPQIQEAPTPQQEQSEDVGHRALRAGRHGAGALGVSGFIVLATCVCVVRCLCACRCCLCRARLPSCASINRSTTLPLPCTQPKHVVRASRTSPSTWPPKASPSPSATAPTTRSVRPARAVLPGVCAVCCMHSCEMYRSI